MAGVSHDRRVQEGMKASSVLSRLSASWRWQVVQSVPRQIKTTSRAVVAAGEQCGAAQHGRWHRDRTDHLCSDRRSCPCRCVERKVIGVAIDNRLDDRDVVAAVSGVALVAGGAEGTFDGVVIGLIAVGGGLVHRRQIRAFEEGIPVVAAGNERLLATIIVMAVLAEGCEIGLIGVDEAQACTAIGHAQVDVAIAVGALIVADNALVVSQRAQNMVRVFLEIVGDRVDVRRVARHRHCQLDRCGRWCRSLAG